MHTVVDLPSLLQQLLSGIHILHPNTQAEVSSRGDRVLAGLTAAFCNSGASSWALEQETTQFPVIFVLRNLCWNAGRQNGGPSPTACYRQGEFGLNSFEVWTVRIPHHSATCLVIERFLSILAVLIQCFIPTVHDSILDMDSLKYRKTCSFKNIWNLKDDGQKLKNIDHFL